MLRELHWLPIKARIEYKLALTCFKSKSGNYPSYISDLLVPYTPSRSLRSSSSNNFSIPLIHLKGFWERAFTDLPTCTDFRGTYRFWPSITISRFHAVVYRFWKMREFLGLSDFGLFCFRRYSRILPAFCTYRQSRRCVAAIIAHRTS